MVGNPSFFGCSSGLYLWTLRYRRWTMVQFKKILRYWLMRSSHLLQERADAMDPNWRGVFIALIFIILMCAVALFAFPELK
jgi:uncharacterized iron-regulated membrane protein